MPDRLAALTEGLNELGMTGVGVSWHSQHRAGTTWIGSTPAGNERRIVGHSRRSHATCRTAACVGSQRSIPDRPASRNDRVWAASRLAALR